MDGAPRPSQPVVQVAGLTRHFDVSAPWLDRVLSRQPRAILTAVSDVALEIAQGEVYGLVGESGSGKSTIGKMLAGLMPPSSGHIDIGGHDPARGGAPAAGVQMIFQDPYASLNPRWRVGDIIAEPAVAQGRATPGLAEVLLEQVGLTASDAERFPHAFSGGQRQRIGIARALAARPRVLICDEPTSALDVSVQAQVLNLMRDLRAEHDLTYLFISHDLTVVRHMADRVGVLYLGRLVEEAPVETLFTDPRHPYTRMLLDAAPRIDAFGREVAPPAGEIPDPIDPPPGCAFHPRCPIAVPQCRVERPPLAGGPSGRVACHLAEPPGHPA